MNGNRLEVRAVAGALGELDSIAASGALLHVRSPRQGGWIELAQGGGALDDPVELSWSAPSSADAELMTTGDHLHLLVTPVQVDGDMALKGARLDLERWTGGAGRGTI